MFDNAYVIEPTRERGHLTDRIAVSDLNQSAGQMLLELRYVSSVA